MGYHVDVKEMADALKSYQKVSETEVKKFETAKNSMNGIITSNTMHGNVGEAISNEINNYHNPIIVGLKDSYKLLGIEFQKTISDFQSATGETSENAVLDEEALTKVKEQLTKYQTTYQESEKNFKEIYKSIKDLLSLDMPKSEFSDTVESSKKAIDKINQKVKEFDQKKEDSTTETILGTVAAQMSMGKQVSGLSYTDPTYLQFMAESGVAEGIQSVDTQLTKAEAEAKKQAKAEEKKTKEDWAKHHPLVNFVQNVSNATGDIYESIFVSYTKTDEFRETYGFATQQLVLLVNGAIGAAGSAISSIAIGATELIQLGGELLDWRDDLQFGLETPQWKLDDIQGTWNTLTSLNAIDIGKKLVDEVVNDVVSGDTYAIGGDLFDIASLFIGIGEVNAGLKGTKTAMKIAEGADAFKAASKVATLSKLEKLTELVTKSMKYGDDALKTMTEKLRNIPIYSAQEELALAGMGAGGKLEAKTVGDLLDGMGKKASGVNINKPPRNLIDNMDEIADDIKNINKKYSNGFEQNNSIDNIINSASYYEDAWEQTSAVTRSIADHAFENGNKRTAFDTLNMLLDDLSLKSPLSDTQKWDLIDKLGRKEITDVSEIANILKGK